MFTDFHSFIGSSEDNYVCHWVQNMTELGYRYVAVGLFLSIMSLWKRNYYLNLIHRSVVFNYRGCSYKLTVSSQLI